LKTFPPAYPELARSARAEGTVVIEAFITEAGSIDDMQIVSGHPMLVGSAIECVRKWVFEPARLNGILTRAAITIQVQFVLTRPNPSRAG
jgi:protein TonB